MKVGCKRRAVLLTSAMVALPSEGMFGFFSSVLGFILSIKKSCFYERMWSEHHTLQWDDTRRASLAGVRWRTPLAGELGSVQSVGEAAEFPVPRPFQWFTTSCNFVLSPLRKLCIHQVLQVNSIYMMNSAETIFELDFSDMVDLLDFGVPIACTETGTTGTLLYCNWSIPLVWDQRLFLSCVTLDIFSS